MPTEGSLSFRFQPLVAWRAMSKLLADGEDTKQAFYIAEALRGGSAKANFNRFRTSPVGAAVLAERRILLDRLCDRATLSALPTDTLGRAYHDFLARENLTAEGLVEASKHTERADASPDVRLFFDRSRDTHDLSHVVTGYGRDGLGEISLLAFAYAQSGNHGLGFISLIAMAKVAREVPNLPIRAAVWEGYRNGRAARRFNEADWEALLSEPLEAVRARLNIRPPLRYRAIMDAVRAHAAEQSLQAA
ncbi:MAG TPA: Coq4 family protein [Aliidongia sp.]|nr:Coq4 family protein [Aliidongia sp.]